jgi:hypothetical protein
MLADDDDGSTYTSVVTCCDDDEEKRQTFVSPGQYTGTTFTLWFTQRVSPLFVPQLIASSYTIIGNVFVIQYSANNAEIYATVGGAGTIIIASGWVYDPYLVPN